MTELHWNNENLTDAGLETKLQRLVTDIRVVGLDLTDNKLTYIPDLTGYIQFRQLKVLCLGGNKIKTVKVAHIPPTCEVLDLQENQISDMPDLRPLTRLGLLCLDSNRIQYLPPSHFPPSLKELTVHSNRLTDIGDLSHLTRLRGLWLSKNPITTKTGLPDSLTDLYTHRVSVLGNKCFSRNAYKLLKHKIHTRSLVQPPAQVFHRGLSDVRSYFEEQQTQSTG